MNTTETTNNVQSAIEPNVEFNLNSHSKLLRGDAPPSFETEGHSANQPHEVGVLVQDPKLLEAVGPQFIREGLISARNKTKAVLEIILAELKEGMTEGEARELALSIFADHGVTKHWHRPYIRFGKGTTLTFNDPMQIDSKLQMNDPLYLDLGPVWNDPDYALQYEGDYGDTFVLGENKEASLCAQAARTLFQEAQYKWKKESATGIQIYNFLKQRAQELNYNLVKNVDGHRIGDFPHHKYSKEHLANLEFTPSGVLWILELQINDPQNRFGAFFEDLL